MSGRLAAHTAALVAAADTADLAAIAEQVAGDSADMRVADPLLLGQTFSLSGPLGGADADIIAGRTLIDLKRVAAERVIRTRDIHQLAGYALADVDDEHCLDTVSFHALRSRMRWRISLRACSTRSRAARRTSRRSAASSRRRSRRRELGDRRPIRDCPWRRLAASEPPVLRQTVVDEGGYQEVTAGTIPVKTVLGLAEGVAAVAGGESRTPTRISQR